MFIITQVYKPLWLVLTSVRWTVPVEDDALDSPLKNHVVEGGGSPSAWQERNRDSPETKTAFVGLTLRTGISGPSKGSRRGKIRCRKWNGLLLGKTLKEIVLAWMTICWKSAHPQVKMQMSLFLLQIWINVALHYLLSNGCSAVNGCRQNESKQLIKASQ